MFSKVNFRYLAEKITTYWEHMVLLLSNKGLTHVLVNGLWLVATVKDTLVEYL